jgi:galactokinase
MDIEQLVSEYGQAYHDQPALLARAPGRVNLLGEHVDYNDGPVLPAAIDRSVSIVAGQTQDRLISLSALDLGEEVCVQLDGLPRKLDLESRPLPAWALYPAGVAWSLIEAGYPLRGLRAVYTSDIPIGAGLSSSAAVEVGFAMLWSQFCELGIERLELARLCQKAENQYVGVACGLMDQFASACGVEGCAVYFDTRSLVWHPSPMPRGTSIVIADSGVRRSLTESAYNERRKSCEQAVALLREYMPDIRALRDVSPTEFAAYGYYLPPLVQRRAEHVVKEINRVFSAVNALRREDDLAFGALMYASHASLRDLYEVSVPELDTLVKIAHGLPGCIGARLTGAGFGGCTVNLVQEGQAEGFIQALGEAYQNQTGRQAHIYLCRASAGVSTQML